MLKLRKVPSKAKTAHEKTAIERPFGLTPPSFELN